MRIQLVILLLSFAVSLCVPADRISKNQFGAWVAPVSSNFATGLGVNIHFTDPQPGELEMIVAAGFSWIRMDFQWNATEREKGHYDFSAYDRLMAALEQHKLHAVFILDYGNPVYDNGAPPRTAETRQAFARWSVTAAKHFASRGVVWEMYNEPNIKIFWPPRPKVDEYIALALEVGRVFRAEIPDEKLIGPATSGIDFAFLEGCFKAGLLNYWSAVSVHPYRRSNPETVANEYYELRKLIEKYAPPRASLVPIISSEWGYSSVWPRMSEENQSAIYTREMLTNIANGIPLSIWYDWRDDGSDATEPEHHFGLVRNSFQTTDHYDAKPAYVAAKTLNALFDGYTFEKRLQLGSDADYVLAFKKDESVRYAAWTTSTPHKIFLPVASQSVQEITHLGLSQFVRTEQSLSIELSPTPIFILP